MVACWRTFGDGGDGSSGQDRASSSSSRSPAAAGHPRTTETSVAGQSTSRVRPTYMLMCRRFLIWFPHYIYAWGLLFSRPRVAVWIRAFPNPPQDQARGIISIALNRSFHYKFLSTFDPLEEVRKDEATLRIESWMIRRSQILGLVPWTDDREYDPHHLASYCPTHGRSLSQSRAH